MLAEGLKDRPFIDQVIEQVEDILATLQVDCKAQPHTAPEAKSKPLKSQYYHCIAEVSNKGDLFS